MWIQTQASHLRQQIAAAAPRRCFLQGRLALPPAGAQLASYVQLEKAPVIWSCACLVERCCSSPSALWADRWVCFHEMEWNLHKSTTYDYTATEANHVCWFEISNWSTIKLGCIRTPLRMSKSVNECVMFQDIARVIDRGPHGIGYEAKGGGPCP